MAQVTAALVKQLREKSGAGMMDCKNALKETDGDLEAAVDLLRTKGLATAAKKAGRVASEGLIGVATDGTVAAAVEVNAETDFVGRNETFQGFVATLAKLAQEIGGDVEALKAADYPGTGRSVADELTQLIATIGENLSLRRVAVQRVPTGVAARYVHGPVATDLGRIGVLVGLESTGDAEKLAALGKQLAMHISFSRPESISAEDLDPALVERERTILADQARESGKPEEIVQKMVDGRIRKYYEDVVLLEQTWVIDDESKVKDVLAAAAKDVGAPVAVSGFTCFVLGEGIEKEEADFAAEVAATLAG